MRSRQSSRFSSRPDMAPGRPATISCSMAGSLSRLVGPSAELSTGSVRHATSCKPSWSMCFSKRALHLATASGLLGKKRLPTPYSPAAGRPGWMRRRKASGTPVRMPAPSPELGSLPQPPRWDMRTSIVLASATILWLGSALRLATMPTPQLSFSSAAS